MGKSKSSKKKTPIVTAVTRRRLNGVRSVPTGPDTDTSRARAKDSESNDADALSGIKSKTIAKLPRKQKARKAITLFHAHTKHTGDLAAVQHDSPVLNAYQQASMKINSTKYPSELLVGLLSTILAGNSGSDPDDAAARPPPKRSLASKLCSFDLPELLVPPGTLLSATPGLAKPGGARLLDVGALEGPVAYRKSLAAGILSTVCSIDLHPQSKDVQACDFFHFPLPTTSSSSSSAPLNSWTRFALQPDPPASVGDLPRHAFDAVSLSLVVNFLPTPAARGAMLRKSLAHLDPRGLRLVYIVLPRACLDNSRYMTHARLVDAVMRDALGCRLVAERWSSKLWCGLFQAACEQCGPSRPQGRAERAKVAKVVVNDGGGRNNFAIVID